MTVIDTPPLVSQTLHAATGLAVVHHRCRAGPGDRPFAEQHRRHSLSLVQRGSFGYCCQGRRFELAAGSLMVGRPGVDYVCSHEHHEAGDECLSFQFDAALADELSPDGALWRPGALAPHPSFALLGGLSQAIAAQRSDVAWDELALLLAGRVARQVEGAAAKTSALPSAARQRAVQAALWIDEHSRQSIELADIARAAGASPFHLLRQFARAFGVTPYQYLIRRRLRDAAGLLADDAMSVTDIAYEVGFGDLSNFVRTFGRAAGLSPSRFRALGRTGRRSLTHGKFLQAPAPLPA